MKYQALMVLLGAVQAAQDPYPCIPDEPCKDKMECLKRTVTDVRDTTLY